MSVRVRESRLPVSLLLGGAILLIFVAAALISPFFSDSPALRIDPARRLMSPGSPGNLLGTDSLGRDVLLGLLAGARNSLYVAVISTLAAIIPGVVLGLVAASAGRTVGAVFNRGLDLALAMPGILIALVLATTTGPGNTTVIIAIMASFIPLAARMTIGPAKQILALDFIEAAYAYGRGRLFVLWRHVLPNILPIIVAMASVMFAGAILAEAALSYLGVGAQPPAMSWGRMLQEAQVFLDQSPTLMVFPGLAIVIAVLAFNLLGHGFRALLDNNGTD